MFIEEYIHAGKQLIEAIKGLIPFRIITVSKLREFKADRYYLNQYRNAYLNRSR